MYFVFIISMFCSFSVSETLPSFKMPHEVDFNKRLQTKSQDSNEVQDYNEFWSVTTAPPDIGNVTLDINPKANSTEEQTWKLPRSAWRFFEYYSTTEEFKEATKNETSCAHDMGQHASQLSNVDGIWVACKSFLEGCESAGGCIPAMKYSGTVSTNPLHTVRIKLTLTGSAIARLTVAGSYITCFDFTHIRDPFSKCTFMNHTTNVPNDDGWSYVQSYISPYENGFGSFSLQLITRFTGDVVLVDKIEATPLTLCGNVTCPFTTVDPSTKRTTTTPSATEDVSTASSDLSSPETTTIYTTSESYPSPCPISLAKTYFGEHDSVLFHVLDVMADGESDRWSLPSLLPRWFTYYDNFDALENDSSNASRCVASMTEVIPDLNGRKIDGLWTSCEASANCDQCSMIPNNTDCYPSIKYSSRNNVIAITIRFYLHKNATLRLHLGCICYDFSTTRDEDSTCEFKPVLEENYWSKEDWTVSSRETVSDFQLDMISHSDPENVVVLDKITLTYVECEGGCAPPTIIPTSAPSSTTEDSTSWTDDASTTTEDSFTSQTDEGSITTEDSLTTATHDGSTTTEDSLTAATHDGSTTTEDSLPSSTDDSSANTEDSTSRTDETSSSISSSEFSESDQTTPTVFLPTTPYSNAGVPALYTMSYVSIMLSFCGYICIMA